MPDKPMTPEEFAAAKAKDLADLKARVEQSLAASVKTLGTLPTPKDAPKLYHLPHDRCWGCVNVPDTQTILTDRAVKALGGSAFTVTVDDSGITVTPKTTPAPAPTPPPTPAPAEPAPATH